MGWWAMALTRTSLVPQTYTGLVRLNIRDVGTVNADTFGALSELTNGCKFEVRRGEAQVTTLDLLDGQTIKNNGDWAHVCFDQNISAAAAGAKQVTARWKVDVLQGRPAGTVSRWPTREAGL
jgi:hypothetical protein